MILIASLAHCRVGDVLLLHRGVNMNCILQRRLAMQINTHPEYALNSFRANAFTKMNRLRTVARQPALEFLHATKCLVVRIAFPLQYHRLIAQVLQLLEDQQPNHQANWFARRT